MSSSPEEFRAFADECITWAKTAQSEEEGQVFLQMARTWIEAAMAMERKPGIVHRAPRSDRAKMDRQGAAKRDLPCRDRPNIRTSASRCVRCDKSVY
jgi:hypothetical protein